MTVLKVISNVIEVLELFRKAEYLTPTLSGMTIRSMKLKPKLTAELVNMATDKFRELLVSNLFFQKVFPRKQRASLLHQATSK